ncbi:MAG: hypothetical protein EA380_01350 [Phycisphaeraceae bacterium]|nr:MAG: hypothetical protein EA380_01350 [Phycisphaeraceae bacterium]
MKRSPSFITPPQWHALSTHEYNQQLRERARDIYDGCTYRWIGRFTGHSNESVRRWLTIGHPPPSFLAATALLLDVSPSWLLLGVEQRDLQLNREVKIRSQDLKRLLTNLQIQAHKASA